MDRNNNNNHNENNDEAAGGVVGIGAVNNDLVQNDDGGDNGDNGNDAADNAVHEPDENDNDDDDDDNDDNENDNDDDNENEEDENIIDGGVATGEGSDRDQPSTSCDMYLIIECTETLPRSLVPDPEPRSPHLQSPESDSDTESSPHNRPIPPHPIYSPGSKVQIGLNKTTTLSAVFERYCEFANRYPRLSSSEKKYFKELSKISVEPSDLVFLHCSILNPKDTAEISALMKKDRIKVRRVRHQEDKERLEFIKERRESDREFLGLMRNFLKGPSLFSSHSPTNSDNGSNGISASGNGFGMGDVVFHCSGKMMDEKGYKQEVLTTYVRGHAAILAKRCKWLRNKIALAKNEMLVRDVGSGRGTGTVGGVNADIDEEEEDRVFEANNRNIVNANEVVPILDNDGRMDDGGRGHERPGVQRIEVEDDEDEEVGNEGIGGNRNIRRLGVAHAVAVHNIQDVSADEDAGADAYEDDSSRNRIRARRPGGRVQPISIPLDGGNDSSVPYFEGSFPGAVCVVLSHPPEAVKILLEYCYSNRVVSLGQKAFLKAHKPVDINTVHKDMEVSSLPLSPFKPTEAKSNRSNWPNEGFPTVSFPVALAGIQLAEEAGMPRLSLMCELAAGELVSDHTALEALAVCEQQKRSTGNPLKTLRRRVMIRHILGHGHKGVSSLDSMNSFQRTLIDKSEDVVPSLMMGVKETFKLLLGDKDDAELESLRIGHGYARKGASMEFFKECDDEDLCSRNKERMKRRQERWNKRPAREEDQNPYGLLDESEYNIHRNHAYFDDHNRIEGGKNHPFLVIGHMGNFMRNSIGKERRTVRFRDGKERYSGPRSSKRSRTRRRR